MAVGTIAGTITAATIFKWLAGGAAVAGSAAIADWLMDKAKEADIDNMGENSVLKNLTANEIKVEENSTNKTPSINNENMPLINDKGYEAAKNNTALDDYETNLGKISQSMKTLGQESLNKTENKNNENKEKDPIPPITGMDSILPGNANNEQGAIGDTTDINLGTNNMKPLDWMTWAEEQQKLRWEREDQIRRETQAREDTAWRRSVDDMLRSGINPNLVGAQPAESGGGITQATGIDTSALTNQMNIDLKEMQQIIDNAFQGQENEKDRFMNVLSQIMSYVGIIMIQKAGKK